MLKEAPAAATLPGAVGQEQNIISATTAITTANDKHADVSVHVEPDGCAGTIAGQANNAVEDAKKQRGAGGEKETRAKCCNCVARLKSCFYFFKLSKMGKVTFTLLAFLVPYDVVTDVIATWELYSSGHGWWGSIAVVILYMSLRFMFLFELMMQQTFLGLEKVCWFEVVDFQVPGRVSSVFWLYLPFSIYPLLLAEHENAKFSVEFMKNKTQFNPTIDKTLLITSALHMRRSLACFEKQGVTCTPYVTNRLSGPRKFNLSHLLIPKAKSFDAWKAFLHELLGFVIYSFSGYI